MSLFSYLLSSETEQEVKAREISEETWRQAEEKAEEDQKTELSHMCV